MDETIARELVADHSRRPRHFGVLAGATGSADGFNAGCGDRVRVFVKIDGGVIVDVGFDGQGCAISQASASLMADAVQGATVKHAGELYDKFHHLLTNEGPSEARSADDWYVSDDGDELGKLRALAGVKKFPIRVKCATLCWHALRAALRAESQTVSTE
jgi:nitrogen fixation NifU-like protein